MEHFSYSSHRFTVLCRKKKGITISEIFKPTDKGEAERIKKEGGFVTTNGRVGGVLAVSRALGDIAFQPFVSPIPGIRKYVPVSFNNNLVIMFLLTSRFLTDTTSKMKMISSFWGAMAYGMFMMSNKP
jgi:hypothetical protein